MGVDGFRLDAIPYLYEREGTNCENLPETHAFLKKLRRHVDEKYRNRLLLAEANQWPEDAVAYFGDGGGAECHMCFHFPVMPRLFMAIQMEDRHPDRGHPPADAGHPRQRPVGAVPAQPRRADAGDGHGGRPRLHVPRLRPGPAGAHQPRHPPPPGAADAEQPAQDRADERPAAVAAGHAGALLRRRDRHGRQHLSRRPQRRPHADAVVVGPQRRLLDGQPAAALPAARSSIRNITSRRSTSRRSRTTSIRCCGGRSGCSTCASATRRSAAATCKCCRRTTPRRWRSSAAGATSASWSWPTCRGSRSVPGSTWRSTRAWRPVEMLGRAKFPLIGDGPYCLTLGPYAFYWFLLVAAGDAARRVGGRAAAADRLGAGAADWEDVFRGKAAHRPGGRAAGATSRRGRGSRGGSDRSSRRRCATRSSCRGAAATARIALVQAEYAEGDPELYVVPLAFAGRRSRRRGSEPSSPGCASRRAATARRRAGVAVRPVRRPRSSCPSCWTRPSGAAGSRATAGELRRRADAGLRADARRSGTADDAAPCVTRASNTTAVLDGRALLKIYRRVEEGPHPRWRCCGSWPRTRRSRTRRRCWACWNISRNPATPMTVGHRRRSTSPARRTPGG